MGIRSGMKRPAPRFTMADGFPHFVTGVDCDECRGVDGVTCDACSSTGWQVHETFGLTAYREARMAGVVTKADQPAWQAWRKDHLCCRCQRELPRFGTRTCKGCHDAYREIKTLRKARGACVRCGAPSEKATVCTTCKEKQRDRTKKV